MSKVPAEYVPFGVLDHSLRLSQWVTSRRTVQVAEATTAVIAAKRAIRAKSATNLATQLPSHAATVTRWVTSVRNAHYHETTAKSSVATVMKVCRLI